MTRAITILAMVGVPEIKTAITAWTERGLLRHSVWIEREELAKDSTNVMSTVVESITPGGAAIAPLRDVLGAASYDLIRVISVRQVVEDIGDSDLNPLLADFTNRLKDQTAETTTVVRVNLLVPGGDNVRATNLLDRDSDVNVVVSPEDRPNESAIDHGLDRPALFNGHTALACATVGALWLHTEDGAFDDPSEFRGGNGGGIAVVRPFARVADGRSLPRSVLPTLLKDGAKSLDQYRSQRHNRVASDKKLVEAASTAFVGMDDKSLCYRPPAQDPPGETKGRVRKTFRMLLQFWLQMFGRNVLQWGRERLEKLDRAAEEWLLNSTSDAWDERMRPSAGEVSDLAGDAPDSMRPNPLMPRTVPAHPYLWPPLRQLSFGLVDDGPLPDDMREAWTTLRPGVSHPDWVSATPDKKFTLDKRTRRILRAYGVPEDDLRPGDSYAADRLVDRLGRADRAVRAGTLSPEERAERASVIKRCQDELTVWQERNHRNESLIGRLVSHVDTEIERAHNALMVLRRDYETQEERRNDILQPLERIRDRLWVHLSMFGGAVVLASALLVAAVVMGMPVWLTGPATAAIVGVVVTLVGVFELAGRASQLEEKLEQVETHRRQTVAAVRGWPDEAQRLGALYDILLDWGEIIGWMLHKPFLFAGVGDDLGAFDPQRPEAFRLGTARIARAEDVTDLASAVTADVFGPGWISALYRTVLHATIPALETSPAPNSQIDPDRAPGLSRPQRTPGEEEDGDEPERGETDSDIPPPPAHARERLLNAFRAEECGRSAGKHLAAAIEEVLVAMPPDRLLAAVQVDDGTMSARPALEFLGDAVPRPVAGAPCPQLAPTIFSSDGRIEGRGKVARVHLWGLASKLLDLPDEENLLLHKGNSAPGNFQYQFAVIRLDVSAGLEEGSLQLPT